MIFTGLKALQERTLSKDDVSEYENSIRMKIVGICL